MKKTALIYALWEKNLAILQHYLQGKTRVVLVPNFLATDALKKLVQASGSQLHILPTDGSARCPDAANALQIYFQGGTASIGMADDAVSQQLLAGIAEDVAKDLPVLQGWLGALDALSDEYGIEVTVLNEDVMRDSKMLALWSKAKGIPVLHVAHGTGLNRDYGGDAVASDHVAVPSQRSAEYFQDMGMPPEQIHVVGNPHWDVLAGMVANRALNRTKLAEIYQLSPTAQWIVWGSTWNAYLSALDNRDFTEQAVQACVAMAALKKAGVTNTMLIFKDRLVDVLKGVTFEQMRDRFMAIAAENDVADQVRYVVDDARHWAACGDVVVSYNSNFAIEAVLSDTPSINLVTDFTAVASGGFGVDDGVLVLEFRDIPATLERLCRDALFRAKVVAAAASRKTYYNAGSDGQSARRTAELIGRCARKIENAAPDYVWQQYLDVEAADVTAAYHTVGRPDLVAMYTNNPAVALDIGCAAGSTGALIKQRFPASQVWGIETNRAAADVARQKLDRVLVGKFEDFDLEQEGIAKGSLDAVLLADVLEHIYNPWDVMVKLRPYMSGTGQLVLSIPNVRNLMMMDELSKGNWTYASQGLLDITHIRFFTFKEVLKFCRETGYRVINTRNALDLRLESFWHQNEKSATTTINTDRLTFKDVTRDELLELCTVQFYVLIEKDPLQG